MAISQTGGSKQGSTKGNLNPGGCLQSVSNVAQALGLLVAVFAILVAIWISVRPESAGPVVRYVADQLSTPQPTPSPQIVYVTQPPLAPLPTHTSYPTQTPYPTHTAYPTYTSYPIPTPLPTYTPRPTYTAPPTTAPTSTPQPIMMSLPFEDNFDTGPKSEWEPWQGTWRMVDGKYTADPDEDWLFTFVGDEGWTDYAVDVDVWSRNSNYPVQIIVRAKSDSYMAVELDNSQTLWILVDKGNARVIARSEDGGLNDHTSEWNDNHVRVEVQGDMYTVYSDGIRLLQVYDSTLSVGRTGLGFLPPDRPPHFDNFQVTELP